MLWKRWILLSLALPLLACSAALAQDSTPVAPTETAMQTETPTTSSTPTGDSATSTAEGVAVTIYNQGTALIRDRRTFELGVGSTTLNFTDVAAGIDPTSVKFVSLTDPDGTYVLEQNYVYDLVNSGALLQRYLDQTIEITTTDGTVFTGQLLSGRGGEIILRNSDGQVIVVNIAQVRDMRFPDLPGGLITRPTLRWLMESATGGAQQLELTYLTSGLNWTADYTVLVADTNRALDLNGWITLNNTSGAAYRDAQVKLIAGDVNRLPEPQAMFARMEGMAMDSVAAAPQVADRQFNEYHLYEIQRPVTIADNETKQVEFVTAAGVPANTFFVYDSSQPFYNYGSPQYDQYAGQTGITDVRNYLEFTTAEDGGVGTQLPAGRIRVYQADIDGSALLIGENQIDHTPRGETIQIYLGNAFDLVGERRQTDFKIISREVVEETYEIRLRNRKPDETVEIRIPEHLFRWTNWEILNSTLPFTQLDSNTIEFRATVEPGAELVLRYTVRYTWS